MKKYKLCPECATHNSPSLLECIECETDLTSVSVVDEEIERLPQNNNLAHKSEEKKVRICDCGAENSPQVRKCVECGEDISDIQPTVSKEKCKKFELISLDGLYKFPIICPVTIIGREQEMREYLLSKPFVSRNHAKVSFDNEDIYITNLSNTNFTYVNNKQISSDSPYKLSDGDEIGLGGMCREGSRQREAAYFIVRASSCI